MNHTTKRQAPSPEELGAKVDNFPPDALGQDREKVLAKIDKARSKLVSKLREKADKAKVAMEAKRDDLKRNMHRQRFELYSDAANDLEKRLPNRQAPIASDREE